MKRLFRGAMVVCLCSVVARADWSEGDAHKMHYPQLPDPTGWDVDITNLWIADDWQCSETGAVSDVHFWCSWKADLASPISGVLMEIWNDVPAGLDPNPDIKFSHPGAVLWGTRVFAPGQFTVQGPWSGEQGWYAPQPIAPIVIPADHQQYWQVNIDWIDDPFIQQQGQTYWLRLHIIPENAGSLAGWKTTQNHWNDDAVTGYTDDWMELRDPENPLQSLDMAFVITPEPGPALLLLVAGLVAAARRRRACAGAAPG